ncbi:MAG: cytochrome c3 family protein [Gemmatimonadota bacterium]
MSARAVMHRIRLLALPGVLITLGYLASACTTEKIVFRDREPFNPPVDTAAGFLGYFTVSSKLTACGNCHIGTQTQWARTKHASAWAGLQTAGAGVQASCYGCHGVSERGNKATGKVGIDFKNDSAYHDVQCESCHGPGYRHVLDPSKATRPLAYAHVGDVTASCASCHDGSHEPYYGQWSQSRHARVNAGEGTDPSGPAFNSSCYNCHNANQAMRVLGGAETSNWLERDSTSGQYGAADCTTCHDPHDNRNGGQLRAPVTSTDLSVNLCARCHNRRSQPASSFSNGARGAHGPQAAVVFGADAGWIPPGFIYDSTQAFTSHTGPGNPRLCAGCHVTRFQVTDPATGNVVFQSVGHLFKANPCLDSKGIPTADDSCPINGTARAWTGCTASGCHATAAAAATAFLNSKQRVKTLVDQIWVNTNTTPVNGLQVVNAGDGGYLATILAQQPGAFNPKDGVSPAEGAYFNAMLFADPALGLSGQPDGSFGVHNPFYTEALLSATIASLKATYPFLPAPPAKVQAIMDQALSRQGVRYLPPKLLLSAR